MLISQLLEMYRVRHPLADSSLYQMRRTVALLDGYLRRPATVEDLTPDTISRWIMALEGTHSQTSVHGHRAKLLILWRFAARHRFAQEPDTREIRRAPRPEPDPVAWTKEQVERIVAVCRSLDVRVCGRLVGPWLVVLVLVAWSTGLRKSDLWRLARSDVGPAGIVTRQAKTRRLVVHAIPDDLRRRLLDLPGEYPLRWWGSPRHFYTVWAGVVGKAGVGAGCLQRIRRSGATAVAAMDGTDAAREFLGHKTCDMWRHYVDRRIAWPRRFVPPELTA
jgi:integrase